MSFGGWFKRQTVEGARDLIKDGRKAVIAFLVVAVPGAALLAVAHRFGLLGTVTSANVSDRLLDWIVDAFKRALRPLSDPKGIATRHPAAVFIVFVFAVSVLIFFRLLLRAYRRVNELSDTLKDADTYRELVSRVGLVGRWAHAAVDGSGAPWGDLCREIARPGNSILYILGANGIETFGGPTSPLHQALRDFRGTTRVTLAHPNCPHTRSRAQSLGTPIPAYKKAIQTSVSFLRELRASGREVDGRYYQAPLNWKMIITSQSLWLQYYRPGGPDVGATPVYRFDAVGTPDGGASIYHCFFMEYQRIWDRCRDLPMQLGGPPPPVPAKRKMASRTRPP